MNTLAWLFKNNQFYFQINNVLLLHVAIFCCLCKTDDKLTPEFIFLRQAFKQEIAWVFIQPAVENTYKSALKWDHRNRIDPKPVVRVGWWFHVYSCQISVCLKSQIHVLCNQETNFHICWCIWAAEIFPHRGITQYFDLGNIQTTYGVPSSSYLHQVCLEINFPVSRHLLCPPFSLETLLNGFCVSLVACQTSRQGTGSWLKFRANGLFQKNLKPRVDDCLKWLWSFQQLSSAGCPDWSSHAATDVTFLALRMTRNYIMPWLLQVSQYSSKYSFSLYQSEAEYLT